MEEIKARGGKIIAIATKGDKNRPLGGRCDLYSKLGDADTDFIDRSSTAFRVLYGRFKRN